MKILKNKNVIYGIWFLEGLPWADSLLLSLWYPFPEALWSLCVDREGE